MAPPTQPPNRHPPTVIRSALVAIVLVVVLTVGALALQSQDQTQRSVNYGRLLLAVSGCEPTDSLDQCRERQRERSAREGRVRTIEVDCLARRALAKLPAPDPARPCVEQTSPAVYPG